MKNFVIAIETPYHAEQPGRAIEFHLLNAQSTRAAIDEFKFRAHDWCWTPRIVFCEELTNEKRQAIREGHKASTTQAYAVGRKWFDVLGKKYAGTDWNTSPITAELEAFRAALIINTRLYWLHRLI